MMATATEVEQYREQFQANASALPGCEHKWVAELRDGALARFTELGFPSLREEAWKYTDVRPIVRKRFQIAAFTDPAPEKGIDLERWTITGLACHRMVFIDGRYHAALSGPDLHDEEGLELKCLSQALNDDPDSVRQEIQHGDDHSLAFELFNSAFMSDGTVIRIRDQVVVERPIHLIYISRHRAQAVAYNIRNIIIGGKNSRATVIESYVGEDDSNNFTNSITRVVMHPEAHLDHYKFQSESQASYHIGQLRALQHNDSCLRSYSIALGGRLARTDITTLLSGENARAEMFGIYLPHGRQHIDHHTLADHRSPNCVSNEHYRGVINDHGRAVFNGKVIVRPGAEKTDARQENHNLMLSDDGEVDTKPELEIYADDVKCSHGATIGQVDQDALFYLRARGIDMKTANQLLTHAFLKEPLAAVDIAELKTWINSAINRRLPYKNTFEEAL